MAKVLLGYYSRTGNTRKMAEIIKEGVAESGVDVVLKEVKDIKAEELLDYDGIVLGGPTYYGSMPGPLKELLDKSVKYHGRLDGKVGGAFSSSANIGGGNETTIMGIIQALLIHGMIVQGDPSGDHYGPVSIGAPDKRVQDMCRRFGRRIGELVKKLFG